MKLLVWAASASLLVGLWLPVLGLVLLIRAVLR
jgi:hypothetical protein